MTAQSLDSVTFSWTYPTSLTLFLSFPLILYISYIQFYLSILNTTQSITSRKHEPSILYIQDISVFVYVCVLGVCIWIVSM